MPKSLRRHARENDANRVLVLVLAVVIVLAVLAALAGELPQATQGECRRHAAAHRCAVAGVAVRHRLFALHYTHLYYGADPKQEGSDRKGLDFPGRDAIRCFPISSISPATLGMTFQTSDTRSPRVTCAASFSAKVLPPSSSIWDHCAGDQCAGRARLGRRRRGRLKHLPLRAGRFRRGADYPAAPAAIRRRKQPCRSVKSRSATIRPKTSTSS